MTKSHVLPLTLFVEAAQKASRRVRLTLLAALIASVICGAAAWNLRPNNWLLEDIQDLNRKIGQREAALFRQGRSMAEIRDDPQNYRALYELETLHGIHEIAQQRLLNNMYFEAKVFGVHFHINDLGVLSGLTLLIVFIFLAFAFQSQFESHVVVFAESRSRKCLRESYALISISQLLTKPPRLENPRLSWLRLPPKLLIFAPLFIHSGILYNDTYTYPDFIMLNRTWAAFALTSGYVLLVLTSVVAIYSYGQSVRFDRLWLKTALEIVGQPAGSGNQSSYSNKKEQGPMEVRKAAEGDIDEDRGTENSIDNQAGSEDDG